MFKLVRDKIPQSLIDNGLACNYAEIKNQELYIAYVKERLADVINEILGNQKLAEPGPVIEAYDLLDILIREANFDKEEIEKQRKEIAENNGLFDNKYIVYFADADNNKK